MQAAVMLHTMPPQIIPRTIIQPIIRVCEFIKQLRRGKARLEFDEDTFCALHKGLDAADTKAYPENKFGPAARSNQDRMLKISAAFAKYGAAVDDQEALSMGQVEQ
jgi:hypothetical protein